MLRKHQVNIGVVCLLAGAAPSPATTYYVNASSSCPGSGTSQNPWCEIYRAFGTGPQNCRVDSPLQSGDEVLVEPGTYNGFQFCGKAVTVLPSSNTGGRVITYTVSFQDGEGSGSVLGSLEEGMGFTISGSNSEGVYVNSASPQILGNVIENNDDNGIYVTNGSPRIEGNRISGNGHAELCGGGIFLENSSASLIDNLICKNRAGTGGGICAQLSESNDLSISNCTIENNTATNGDATDGTGGGINLSGLGSTITISRTVFRDNQTALEGAGVRAQPPQMAMAVVSCDDGFLTLNIDNTLILENRNTYAGDGGGIALGNCVDATITNCTIVENFAMDIGGGLAIIGPDIVEIHNSILWGNDGGNGQDQIGIDSQAFELIVQYSDIEGGWEGYGNIDDDPLFCAPSVYNYHLRGNSFCIDAGNNSAVVGDDDYDGNPRIVDGPDAAATATVDMGCYEYQYNSNVGCTMPGVAKSCPNCESASIVSANPTNGKRDARQPHPDNDNSFTERQGIGSPNSYTDGPEPITIELDITGADSPDCWSICETGIETMEGGYLDVNYIASVTEVDSGVYELLLDRPISAGHWTTISYFGGDDYVEYASLPADANASGLSSAADITDWIDCCYYSTCTGYNNYRCDLNHTGAVNTADYLTLLDLLSGIDKYIAWNGVYLPSNTCPGDSINVGQEDPGGDVNANLAEWIANYLTMFDPDSQEAVDDFEIIVDGLTQWVLDHFTSQERTDLADALSDPKLEFASQAGADAAAGVVEAIAP